MMNGSMVGWMWIWPLLVLVGLLIIGYVVMRLVQGSRPPTSANESHASSARQILDERFARGEIDEDEYQRRRNLLS